MKFLHVCWCDNALYVWAEKDVNQADLLSERDSETGYSPFSLGAQELRTLLESLIWFGRKDLASVRFAIDLPSITYNKHSIPHPSRLFLIRNPGKNSVCLQRKISVKSWYVDAVRLSRRQMIAFFSICRQKRVAPGIFLGNDVFAVRNLYRFAGALIARSSFLPGVSNRAGEYYALWHPVLSVVDEKRFRRICSQIPDISLAGASREQDAEDLLYHICDSIVRLSVTTTLSRAQAVKGKFYSVHDAWMAALRGESPLIRWEEDEDLLHLEQTLREWHKPIDFARESNITLIFELHEPADPSKREWFLEVKYRRNEREYNFPCGSSLFKNTEISEHILLSLGQAVLLFSPLERMKKYRRGSGIKLTHQEAHTFINQTVSLLRASGYEISVPQWCAGKVVQPFALNAEILPHSKDSQDEMNLESSFDLKWNVTLDGEAVSQKELEALLEEQSSLVYFRGRWIEIDIDQLQEALRIWKRKRRETHSAREIMQLSLGGIKNPHGLDIRELRGTGWIDDFLNTLKGESRFKVIIQPRELNGSLRPYQLIGFSWLVFLRNWNLGACLADDMGLGKTVQTIAFILHEKANGATKPVLIAGPTSILGNWMHELRHFAPSLKCIMHHGPKRAKAEKLEELVERNDVVVTSYNLLYKDYRHLKKIRWSCFVVDEAQNIKNSMTQQAQAARAVQADYRVALTGTPMENNVGDIWSLMDFLNPGLLGGRRYFHDTFFKPIQSGRDLKAKNRLKKITSSFILRRLKTDRDIIRDLPEKVENKVYCTLSLEQKELYQDITDSFNREIEDTGGIKRRGAILAVLTRLKQICNHPANYLGETEYLANRSGKLDRLVEMLEEVFQQGESALVFTQFAEMGALIKDHVCRTFAVDVPFIYGGTDRKNRDRLIDAFQQSEEPTAFVLSLKAGGTGLNLTRANHVFHFDRWWNPAVENQATDRAFRIGQKKNVMVHKFICAGTLEEKIDALMVSKLTLTDEIVSNGEKFLTEFNNRKLRQFLQLSDAVLKSETGDE
ncbi:MAG: DEAD/DEAH box helicase [Kiritimatiellia bacterium]